MQEPLLAAYSVALGGLEFAAWTFAFETRKTFRGGIFWGAWRLIATALPCFMVNQAIVFYEAVSGLSFAADVVRESFTTVATLFLLFGFYKFYKAWNPKAENSAR